MSREVVVVAKCDLCGRKDVSTPDLKVKEHSWSWNGVDYQIGVCNNCLGGGKLAKTPFEELRESSYKPKTKPDSTKRKAKPRAVDTSARAELDAVKSKAAHPKPVPKVTHKPKVAAATTKPAPKKATHKVVVTGSKQASPFDKYRDEKTGKYICPDIKCRRPFDKANGFAIHLGRMHQMQIDNTGHAVPLKAAG